MNALLKSGAAILRLDCALAVLSRSLVPFIPVVAIWGIVAELEHLSARVPARAGRSRAFVLVTLTTRASSRNISQDSMLRLAVGAAAAWRSASRSAC